MLIVDSHGRSRPGQVIPKTIIKMVQTASLHCTHALGYDFNLTVQPDCLKGQVVCGTVYGEMHLKDPLGSITRVGFCIPVPDFYLVIHVHALSAEKAL